MNGQELYEELKAFLKYVGLSFNDMDKIKIMARPNEIDLIYGKYTATICIEEDKKTVN